MQAIVYYPNNCNYQEALAEKSQSFIQKQFYKNCRRFPAPRNKRIR